MPITMLDPLEPRRLLAAPTAATLFPRSARAPMTAPRVAFVKTLAAGDFNNDHATDVVVSINRGEAFPFSDARGTTSLRIFLANPPQDGAVTFAPNPRAIWLPDDAFAITTADLNADGNLDLVVTTDNDARRGGMRLFLGRGDGTFTKVSARRLLFYPSPIRVADFNADGLPDLAWFAEHNEGSAPRTDTTYLSVLLNSPAGFARKPYHTPFPVRQTPDDVSTYAFDLVAADFNADGKADVAMNFTTDTGYETRFPTRNAVLTGRGDGTFNLPASDLATSPEFDFVTAGDLNNDGRPDLVTSPLYQVTAGPIPDVAPVYLSSPHAPTGFATAPGIPPGIDLIGPAMLADFDGDHRLDLLLRGPEAPDPWGTTKRQIRLGRGDGTFATTGVTIDTFNLFNCIPADLNADGKADLVSATPHQLAVLLT